MLGVTGIAGDGWTNSGLGLLADAFIIAIAVMGVNLITGYTGQLSIGHAAFFAIGAYTGLVLTDGRVSTPFFGSENIWDPGWTIPVAAALCFVVGCVVGLPALRLKGIYLALTTLVFVEAVRSTLKYEKFESITGGSTGIKGDKYTPPEYVFDVFGLKLPTGLDGRADLNQWMIYLSLALLLFIMLLVSGLMRSRIGRAMVATCDNELAAEVMGVNLSVIKTVVFGLSGAITGVGGALFGLKLGLVDGDVPLFGLFGAITFLVAMVVGGAAQNWGPLVGAVFYVFVNEIARSVGEAPSDYESTFVVVLVVLVVIVVGVVIRYLMLHADDIRSNVSNGTVKAVAVVVRVDCGADRVGRGAARDQRRRQARRARWRDLRRPADPVRSLRTIRRRRHLPAPPEPGSCRSFRSRRPDRARRRLHRRRRRTRRLIDRSNRRPTCNFPLSAATVTVAGCVPTRSGPEQQRDSTPSTRGIT